MSEEIQNKSHWPVSIMSSLSSVLNILVPLVLVRILSNDAIGMYKSFALFLMIAPAPTFAMGLINNLSYWGGRGREGRAAIQTTGTLLLLLSALTFCAILGLQNFFAHAFHWSIPQTKIFALAVAAAIASRFYEEAAISLGRIWSSALYSTVFDLLRTLVIIVTAISSRDLHMVLKVLATMLLLKAFCGYLLAERQQFWQMKWAESSVSEVLKLTWPISLAGLLSIPISYADQLILSSALDPSAFALYSIGCLALPPLLMFEYSVVRVLIPKLSLAFSQGTTTRASALYQGTIQELALFLFPAAFGLCLFAEPIITLLFTARYVDAAIYLRIYAFSYLLLSFPHDAIPRARAESNWILKNFILFSGLATAACFIGTHLAGASGALVALLFSQCLMKVYGIWYAHKSCAQPILALIPGGFLLKISGICLTLCGLCLCMRPLFVNPISWFCLSAILFSGGYMLLLCIFKPKHSKQLDQSPSILMLTQFLEIGGLERMLLTLSRQLKKTGHWQVSAFVYDRSQNHTHSIQCEFFADDIAVESCLKGRGFSLKVVSALVRKIVREQIDLIHTHDLGALIYGSAAKLFCPYKVAIIHTQHSFVHLNKHSRYRFYEKLFTRFADKVVVVSPSLLETYRELGLSASRLISIENGIDVPETIEFPRDTKNARIGLLTKIDAESAMKVSPYLNEQWILCLGRLQRVKGPQDSLALWATLPEETRDRSILLVVGPEGEPGFRRELEEIKRTLPSKNRVIFIGATHMPGLWISASDLFISCSQFEGLPLGPLEAIARGVPTILSRIPGHLLLERASRQFNLGETGEASRLVVELLLDISQSRKELIMQLQASALWVREQFSSERMRESYEIVYYTLLNESSQSGSHKRPQQFTLPLGEVVNG